MTYSGKRIPRDNDPEKWRIFFKANPKRKKEFKEKWVELNPPRPKKPKKTKKVEAASSKIIETKTQLVTSKEGRTLSNLVGSVFWSGLLGGTITLTRVDLDRDIVNMRIMKNATMSISEFANLPADHFGSGVSNDTGLKALHRRQIDTWDEESVEAFRQFKEFLAEGKSTPMREWVEDNLK